MYTRNDSQQKSRRPLEVWVPRVISALLLGFLSYNDSLRAGTCPCDGRRLVAWWRAEGDATDMAGGHNGTLGGDVTFVSGVAGQAFRFDGDGDGVAIGNPPELQLQDFTVSGWVRRANSVQVSNASIYGEILGYGWGGYVFGFLPDGTLFLSKYGIDYVASLAAITDTDWHHVAVTKTGISISFYIDGQLDSNPAYTTFFEFFTDLDIGAVNATFDASFWGDIDELQVYDAALNGAEISFLYDHASGRVGNQASCNDSLQTLADAFRTKFNNPTFQIQGSSTAGQVEAVVSAILKLNYGEQQNIYLNLGGTKSPR